MTLKFKPTAFVLFLASTLTFVSCEEFQDLDTTPLTEEEIGEGLKAALERGTEIAVDTLNVTDGYYGDQIVKIFLPPEADVIIDAASLIPGGETLIENTIEAVNRSAEDAAAEATPIFVDAITSMTIEDAIAILHGEDTAATGYLRENTYLGLYDTFQPKIDNSLNKELILGQSAASMYEDVINTYNNVVAGNSFGLIAEIEENNLSEWTTKRALDGLFVKVADEEGRIRTDVSHRVNEILEKVFAELDQ